MKNRILFVAALFFAGIAITSCSKEKINEIAKNHSRDNARSSGQSSSSDSSPSSDYGSCNNHGDNSGSSSNSGSGSN